MNLTRRSFLALGGATALAACTPQAPSAQPAAPAAPSVSTPVPTTRSFTHVLGTVTIPTRPLRPVVLEFTPFEALLAVDVVPVAYATGSTGIPAQLKPKGGNLPTVGSLVEPDLESIALQKPDIILAVKALHEAIASKLNAIAPTVYSDAGASQWKDNLTLFADAVGKADIAKTVLNTYNERAKKLAARHSAKPKSVSLVWFGSGTARVYLKGAFSGSILEDAGVARPTIAQRDGVWLALSPELLPELEADHILIMRSADSQTIEDRTKQAPLWLSMNAVKRGAVHDVSAEHWFSGGGLISANLVLEDLEKILV